MPSPSSRRNARRRREAQAAHERSRRRRTIRPRDVLVFVAIGILGLGLIAASCTAFRPSPEPSPSAGAALPPGTYRSQVFQPALTLTLPAGWRIATDTIDYFAVQPVESDVQGIHVFSDPQPARQDAACTETPEPSVGTLDVVLSSWIRSRPGLTASAPRLVTIGGFRGVELDLAIASTWTQSCPFANGLPAVPLFVGPNADYRWVIAGSERLRLDIFDVGGRTVVVDVDAFDGSLMESLVTRAQPIVESLTFSAPGESTGPPGG